MCSLHITEKTYLLIHEPRSIIDLVCFRLEHTILRTEFDLICAVKLFPHSSYFDDCKTSLGPPSSNVKSSYKLPILGLAVDRLSLTISLSFDLHIHIALPGAIGIAFE